jgi:hypothetical protein
MRKAPNQRSNWAGLPLIATIARLLCRKLTLQNEYLRQENKILRSKVKGRIRFKDDERRSLVDAALAMGRNGRKVPRPRHVYGRRAQLGPRRKLLGTWRINANARRRSSAGRSARRDGLIGGFGGGGGNRSP